uniref:Uncharacterized protein n=1 Tax=Sinocyclocheilus anshuiensis TaxID=1608454 RepID=A0A671S1Y3_9TELE
TPKMRMFFFFNMDVEMLLSLVSEHRELLNKSHTDYKNQDKKRSFVAKNQIRGDREKRLMSVVVNRLQKKKPWKFMKVMEFLAASREPQNVHSNIEECDCELEDGNGSDNEQATCSSGASTTSSEPVQSSSKKRKQPETPDFMERYLAAKEARENEREEHRELHREDNVSLFLQSLAPVIRRLPPSKQSSQPVSYHRAPPQTPPQYNNSANS